jgi:hypothetical protein
LLLPIVISTYTGVKNVDKYFIWNARTGRQPPPGTVDGRLSGRHAVRLPACASPPRQPSC